MVVASEQLGFGTQNLEVGSRLPGAGRAVFEPGDFRFQFLEKGGKVGLLSSGIG